MIVFLVEFFFTNARIIDILKVFFFLLLLLNSSFLKNLTTKKIFSVRYIQCASRLCDKSDFFAVTLNQTVTNKRVRAGSVLDK